MYMCYQIYISLFIFILMRRNESCTNAPSLDVRTRKQLVTFSWHFVLAGFTNVSPVFKTGQQNLTPRKRFERSSDNTCSYIQPTIPNLLKTFPDNEDPCALCLCPFSFFSVIKNEPKLDTRNKFNCRRSNTTFSGNEFRSFGDETRVRGLFWVNHITLPVFILNSWGISIEIILFVCSILIFDLSSHRFLR
jgi:hypothetical protein